MSYTAWNNQGTQSVPMFSVNNTFGWGYNMSQYYNNTGTYKVNYNWPGSPVQGSRGLSGMASIAYVYIYGQGGTFGSSNGGTTVLYNQGQGQTVQTVNLQASGNRMWVRNFTQATGYGGGGAGNLQGQNTRPASSAGSPAFRVQGYIPEFIFNSQGYYVVGGGGGGGAGNQGNRANQGLLVQSQFSPSGGGGGGGGGGYGAAGPGPDARYQGGGGQGGFSYGLGGGGGNGGGGRGANNGAPGGNSGNYGGNAGSTGSPPGQAVSGSWGYGSITY